MRHCWPPRVPRRRVSLYQGWPFLSDPGHPFLSAVWAVLVHGCVSLLVVAPILRPSRHRTRYALLAFAGGSAIDVDHFLAATTLNLHTVETLSGRPATHSSSCSPWPCRRLP
jgi:hypothetical protein